MEEIYKKVENILLNDFEIEPEKIRMDAHLREDIGIDSLDFVDIVVAIERDFGFKPTTQELKQLATVDDLCRYILEQGTKNKEPRTKSQDYLDLAI